MYIFLPPYAMVCKSHQQNFNWRSFDIHHIPIIFKTHSICLNMHFLSEQMPLKWKRSLVTRCNDASAICATEKPVHMKMNMLKKNWRREWENLFIAILLPPPWPTHASLGGAREVLYAQSSNDRELEHLRAHTTPKGNAKIR